MVLENKHLDFIKGILGLGNNLVQLKEQFNDEFGEKISLNNFRTVLKELGINIKVDNKAKFEHNVESVLSLVRSNLGKGLSKAQIYDIVNKVFPCTLTAFNSVTDSINWRTDNKKVFQVELNIV